MANKTSPFAEIGENGKNVNATSRVNRIRGASARTVGTVRRKSTSPSPIVASSRKRETPAFVTTRALKMHRDEWLDDNEVALFSPRTIGQRRDDTDRLLTFLTDEDYSICSGSEMRKFFATLINRKTGKPLAVDTIDTYRRNFNALWNWMKKQDLVTENAMDAIPPIPKGKKRINQQVQPFAESQWRVLMTNAAKTPNPRRDVALLHLLIDTGLRASEVCQISMKDLSMSSRSVRVKGKGARDRTIFYSPLTSKLIWALLREREIDPDDCPGEPLFVASTGKNAGGRMCPRGIYAIVSKLCAKSGINDGKKGPHRLRHTFATEMVRNSAYQDVVQQLLGHADSKMTQRYVTLAQHDLRDEHGRSSPLNVNRRAPRES